jgi:hypothetical protein
MYQQYKEQIKYLVWLYAGAPSPAAKKKKKRDHLKQHQFAP